MTCSRLKYTSCRSDVCHLSDLGTTALHYSDACAVYVVIEYLALLLYCRLSPQASPYGICDGQSGTGEVYVQVFRFFPAIIFLLVLRTAFVRS
jgi:hypothetical protein